MCATWIAVDDKLFRIKLFMKKVSALLTRISLLL